MKSDVLTSFARQLQSWSEEQLQARPGPIRAVECRPELITAEGRIAPDLVFWSNRDSFQAAGLLVLPEDDRNEAHRRARLAAEALGIGCYHSWDIDEITAWPSGDAFADALWRLPARTDTPSPAVFRDNLLQLIRDIETRHVSALASPTPPSGAVIANLLNTTLQSLQNVPGQDDDSGLADRFIDLLRLYACYASGSLPGGLLPERLAGHLAGKGSPLPNGLPAPLQPSADEAPAGPAAGRILHQLYMRLQAIGIPDDDLARVLTLLLPGWLDVFGGHPVPDTGENPRQTTLLNPDSCSLDAAPTAIIATRAIISADALVRHLANPDRPLPAYHQLDDINRPLAGATIAGTLSDTRKPAESQRTAMTTRLRLSWPNRRFSLPASTPQWIWQAIQLLGLCGDGCRLVLHLPYDLLHKTGPSLTLLQLMLEQGAIRSIGCPGDDLLRVDFRKGSRSSEPVLVMTRQESHRQVGTPQQPVSRAMLLLSLALPEEHYRLLDSGQLRSLDNAEKEKLSPRAVRYFLASTLGKGLCSILTSRRQLPTDDKLLSFVLDSGLPLPEPGILSQLEKACRKQEAATQLEIDQELAIWLGDVCRIPIPDEKKSRPVRTRPDRIDEKALQDIIRSGCRNGIPRFPDDYLYSIPESALEYFEVGSPLHPAGTFFNLVTLQDDKGTSIEIAGKARARALQLAAAAAAGRIALPKDDETARQMLERFRDDLLAMQGDLVAEITGRTGSADESLLRLIWQRLSLPDPAALVL